jgi:uncharacterized damage-inducible protein DinB
LSDELGIPFESLLRYDEQETEHWRVWFGKRPYLLKLDLSPSQTIGECIFHIFSAAYRIAERLLHEQMTPDSQLKHDTVDELFDLGRHAQEKFRTFLSTADPNQISNVRVFPSPTLGEFQASSRKLLTHALVHSIRHWAQIATVLREHGHRADWSHDLLFSKVIE